MKFVARVRKVEYTEIEVEAANEAEARLTAMNDAVMGSYESQWWECPRVEVETIRARNPYIDAVRIYGDEWVLGFHYEERMAHRQNEHYPRKTDSRDSLVMEMATKYGTKARHWQCEPVMDYEFVISLS